VDTLGVSEVTGSSFSFLLGTGDLFQGHYRNWKVQGVARVVRMIRGKAGAAVTPPPARCLDCGDILAGTVQ